ncbi:2OG-Fe dioxygenase family protein [Leptolyngbya cf. ectocarpi LEGE 11479]|uniref:2OG-Fe dioxygenase family protein n=1 Tax=Leptolyngbya cf. ectocarpi LEGE 11479 TaxID=1828722 RepID=A0A929F6J9_LEPEC|nr:2OG-Fe dioxygenase family protein [Leptolyngbya ectocarpi]MBE9068225.1 2OG-Fe dioxygenase family protein [Leptolyngbya cf. ectocarpi LEGE 11479]
MYSLKINTKTTLPTACAEALALSTPLLSQSETLNLLSSCGSLGPDPSSQHFTRRTKSIAYVMCIEGQWFQLRADFFSQPQQYNDFSGGYKRFYRELPAEFLACKATQKVLSAFQQTYRLPEKELMLVQVQTSHINHNNIDQCLTGQGIHSDGADRAMLVCLQRDNVTHAESAIYHDLKGHRAVLDPFILQQGHGLLWQDNQVFHHVAPAQLADPHMDGSRTVLIAHYPAFHYLSGKPNPNNTLGTNQVSSRRRLRLQH